MKSKAIVCAIAAATLGLSSLSFAQSYDRRGNEQRQEQRGHDNRGDYRGGDRRDDGARNNDRGNEYGARGPQFRRGGHIPAQYRSRQYVVNDWRGHHLSAPPRGHQWVQVGGDYVLVAVATGLIANLILNQ